MRYLITGGCGFIGANLSRLLAKRGCRLRVLDDLSVGSPEDLPEAVEIRAGSVLDADALSSACAGVDAVVHLAAQTGVVTSIRDPLADFETNARGTLMALLAARDAGVRAFVLASSNAPLGGAEPPVREETVARPLSPYGASKLCGEAYLSAFHGSYGLRTVALRFANAYGPWSTHKTSVVAQFFRDATVEGRLVIYGDGRQTRDFVHAEDVARAIEAAVERGRGGEVYNVGTGRETTVAWLAERVASLVERPVSVEYLPARKGEIVRTFVDIGKARRELGYEPQVDLAAGLLGTWEWFRSRATDPAQAFAEAHSTTALGASAAPGDPPRTGETSSRA